MLIKYHNYKFEPYNSNNVKYIPGYNRRMKYGAWFLYGAYSIIFLSFPRFIFSLYENFYPLEERIDKRLAKKEAYEILVLSKNQFNNNFIKNSSTL
ncbi:hypothetical protein ABPG74_022008 [Tetrahymena malaccensis]